VVVDAGVDVGVDVDRVLQAHADVFGDLDVRYQCRCPRQTDLNTFLYV
jgi:hypothetical protein